LNEELNIHTDIVGGIGWKKKGAIRHVRRFKYLKFISRNNTWITSFRNEILAFTIMCVRMIKLRQSKTWKYEHLERETINASDTTVTV
jgi:hypothetical protein